MVKNKGRVVSRILGDIDLIVVSLVVGSGDE